MIIEVFRGDLLKLCAAGNCILVHNMIGIFESLQSSLRLTEVLEHWFLILLLPIESLLFLPFTSGLNICLLNLI